MQKTQQIYGPTVLPTGFNMATIFFSELHYELKSLLEIFHYSLQHVPSISLNASQYDF